MPRRVRTWKVYETEGADVSQIFIHDISDPLWILQHSIILSRWGNVKKLHKVIYTLMSIFPQETAMGRNLRIPHSHFFLFSKIITKRLYIEFNQLIIFFPWMNGHAQNRQVTSGLNGWFRTFKTGTTRSFKVLTCNQKEFLASSYQRKEVFTDVAIFTFKVEEKNTGFHFLSG